MKTWTTQAERRLEEYLREKVVRENLDGVEAAELKDDLRRHVHEEAGTLDAATIGLPQLETLLGRLDAGYSPKAEVKHGFWSRFGRSALWFFGVILPLGVTIFEALAFFCGRVFFDPVPTFWHLGLVLLVPLVNGGFLLGMRRMGETTRGLLAGLALFVSMLYALLFLPLAPISVMALLAFGLGLLSLMPLFAAIATWRIGRTEWKHAADPAKFRHWRRMGVLGGLLAFLVLEGPAVWTRMNLQSAAAKPAEATGALARLRAFHSESTLLAACYEGGRGTTQTTDLSGWLFYGWNLFPAIIDEEPLKAPDTEAVRDVFFRVTGKPFNAMPPPKFARASSMMGRGGNRDLDTFQFDDHVGTDQVAVRLKDLDLAESRFDGHLDSVSRTAYGEWTMVFHNRGMQSREARCQVRLPRGGRVSRLTLWINGEPREAAFGPVAAVKEAYQEVAVRQNRDPVLVTMVAPDTVMVQCFPVPGHGEMKIRFGVTSPLDGQRWELPRILERNFGTVSGAVNTLWLQGDGKFSLEGAKETRTSATDGEGTSLSAEIPLDGNSEAFGSVKVGGVEGPAPVVWCEDDKAKSGGRFLVREPVERIAPACGKVVIVVDGSAALAGSRSWLQEQLGNLASDPRYVILLADDTARRVNAEELGSYRFTGGRDNEPALREAVRLAKETESAAVLWLHGPQAVKLARPEALLQLAERGTHRPVIQDIELAPGPNRLAETLYRSGLLKRGPDAGADFPKVLRQLVEGRPETAWTWRRADSPDGLPGRKVWDQLARLWAIDAAEGREAEPAAADRPQLAARYQLVTPVSAAVVLETKEQYDRHDLAAVDSSAAPQIPSIPEPSASLLLLVTASLAALHRRRAA